MAVATVIYGVVNPNDTAQRYVLHSNGRIDAEGGAVPVTDQQTWYTRADPPAVAMHVSNWTTGAGYTLDYRGGVHPFGGNAYLGSGDTPERVPGLTYSSGPLAKLYCDWSWDPAGTGQFYVMDRWGGLTAVNGATAPTIAGSRFASDRGRKLEMRWTPDKRALIIDLHGRMYANFVGSAPTRPSSLGKLGVDRVRDFKVTDWTTASGHILDLHGYTHAFGSATQAFGFPYNRGGDLARVLEVLSSADPQTFWQVWAGGQQFEYTSSTAPTVVAGGGQSEVQRVTITGTPTGGTFTLTYSGQTTAAIARNAVASTVQTALENLSNLAPGDVVVTGGPGPSTPWTVSFGGTLRYTDVSQMTATSSLTGGTSPAVAVTTTQTVEAPSPAATVTTTTRPVLGWDYSDPQGDSQAAWQLYVFTETFAAANTMTDPSVHAASAVVAEEGSSPTTRGISSPVDFTNQSYRLYVRAQDSADLWSPWSEHKWTQNVPAPVTPTSLTATANQAAYSVALSVSATTGGSANLIRFECSDDAGVTWGTVRGAGAVTLASTTTATDWDPPLGVTRQYRAKAYAVDPAVVSAASNVVSATITQKTYVLRAVDDSSLGGRVWAQDPVEWTRPVAVGIFQGLGAEYPTVLSDGVPKSKRCTLRLAVLDAAGWTLIEGLAESDSVLVYRDPHGSVRYCRLAGDWSQAYMKGAPGMFEQTTALPLVEVAPPES